MNGEGTYRTYSLSVDVDVDESRDMKGRMKEPIKCSHDEESGS